MDKISIQSTAVTHSDLEPVKHGRMNYKDTKPYMSAFL
jgi:hypothetical protein